MIFETVKLVCPTCKSDAVKYSADEFTCRNCQAAIDPQDIKECIETGKTRSGAYDLSDHPKHAAALGNVISAWAGVEDHLCILAAFLMRAPPWQVHAAFFSIVANAARLQMLKALASQMVGADEFGRSLDDLLKKVRVMADRRNYFAHRRWCRGADSADVYVIDKIQTPVKQVVRKVHPDEILMVAKEIVLLDADISKFIGDYSRAHPLSLDTSDDEIPSSLKSRIVLDARRNP